MQSLLLLLSVLVALSSAVSIAQPGDAATPVLEFAHFIQKYNKHYTIEEYPVKFKNFLESQRRIQKRSETAAGKGFNTQFGITKFSDLTPQEFKTKFMGHKRANTTAIAPAPVFQKDGRAIPTAFDWRTRGAVTPVKDQQQCGSCWAFSATEGVESAYFLKKNKLFVLSPQQIVSCDTVDTGCNGGDLPTAFQYVQSNGMETDSVYPYTSGNGNTGTCKYQSNKVVVQISGFQYATQNGDEVAMQQASLTNGPLSICVDAETWQDYTGGVITNDCGDSLDHCVQIVGWNTDTSTGTSIPYWIIRNSWNTDWGINGFIYVERGKDLCGVSDEATYVTI
jgi:C1A family cysteine protease